MAPTPIHTSEAQGKAPAAYSCKHYIFDMLQMWEAHEVILRVLSDGGVCQRDENKFVLRYKGREHDADDAAVGWLLCIGALTPSRNASDELVITGFGYGLLSL